MLVKAYRTVRYDRFLKQTLAWKDLFNCSYVQAGRTWTFQQDFEIRGDVQFVEQCSVGRELLGTFNTQLYGARFTLSYANALLSVETNETASGTGIRNPFGGDPTFNSLMISNFNNAGEKAYGAGITYDFSKLGLVGVRAFAAYAYGIMSARPVGRGVQRRRGLPDQYRCVKKFFAASPVCSQRFQYRVAAAI